MDNTFTTETPSLETTKQQFQAWREGRRTRRDRIPQHLWQAAVNLCEKHSINHVSRQLRLGFSELKKRVSQDTPIRFTQLDLQVLSGQWQIECSRGDGAMLRMTGSGQPPAVEILKSFLS